MHAEQLTHRLTSKSQLLVWLLQPLLKHCNRVQLRLEKKVRNEALDEGKEKKGRKLWMSKRTDISFIGGLSFQMPLTSS